MKVIICNLIVLMYLTQLPTIQCVLRKIDLSSYNTDVRWTLKNGNKTITVQGSVPGGVYSDLQKAHVIGDILYRFNDVQTRWIAFDTWTYTAWFNVNKHDLTFEIANLVLEGVDTISFIELNNIAIGSTKNMFVRYVFDVKEHLKIGVNKLSVQFVSPVHAAKTRSEKHFAAPSCVPDVYNGECHANQLRKMQASFSWDWGPAFPSVGIWKPAYIELYDGAIIRSVTTHIVKKDPLWDLKIVAHLESGKNKQHINGYLNAVLAVDGGQSFTMGKQVDIVTRDDGTTEVDITMDISQNVVSFWWPNGFGEQPLYDLDVTFTTHGTLDEVSHKNIKIGFRTIEVVEEDASTILGNTTAGQGLTFYFKVNGYPLFMKGSNWIPAHILPELGYNKATVDSLLTASRDTHMAMLRVWGGGVYESDYFYERCDQLGILIWQDFLFACSMYPADSEFLENVKDEIQQAVIRLQHHPSIAIWAGNNENEVALRGNWYGTQGNFSKYKEDYIKLYVDTMKPIVESLDPGRRYLVSSPSNGIQSEREGYIALNPYDSNYGDTHYYNYIADNWDFNIYPKTRFASEYGFQSLPSLETMLTATNNKEDFNLDSEYSKHRQHSPNGYTYITYQINKRLKLNEDDANYFKKFVFYSQISQAMAIKVETEFYRQSRLDWNTMGALYWQLNDVWQAPSWSGIEYGGKWKMLHYFAKSFFAPVLISPQLLITGDVDIYLINDKLVPVVDGNITIEYYYWNSSIPFKSLTFSASGEALSSTKQTSLSLWSYNVKEFFFTFSLKIDDVLVSPSNHLFPVPLKDVQGLERPNIKITVFKRKDDLELNGEFRYVVNIEVDTVVLFFWMEADKLDGHFVDNGLILTRPLTQVEYVIRKDISENYLEKSINYQYYEN